MYTRVSLLLLVFLQLLASGCKKEKDDQKPLIEIILPGSSATLHVPDTLVVRVNVSDDEMVKNVWFTLGDANGGVIAQSGTVEVNAMSATVERMIIVNDASITSGTYTLSVRANDGTNTSTAFRSVNVSEEELRLRAIFITSPSGSIIKIDSVGTQSIFSTFNEISEADINSFTQQLFIATGFFDPLQVLTASDQGNNWQLPNTNPQSTPYFTAIHTDESDDRTYVCTNEGYIRGYTSSGIPQFTAQALSGFRPYQGVVAGDRYISEQHAIALNEKRLVNYTYANGSLLEQFALDLDVIAMFPASDQLLVFGNRNGDGVIQSRNITQGGIYEMQLFSGEEIIAVDLISPSTYVVAKTDQVVRFQYTNNSIVPLMNAPVTDIAYEKAGGAVLVGLDQQIQVIDPMNGNLVNTIGLPDPIGKILPLFNR
ncbi:MAG: Ig-like domain-containing protein [Bacteroidota bacterium]|nr:Ig-like domain-containing protein [Bacteroidota bacterium]